MPSGEPQTETMSRALRVLIVEDSEFDAQMLVSILRAGGYEVEFERVETARQMERALREKKWDVILADYNLPDFNALEALKLLQSTELDLPFIIVSGGIGEDIAVAAMKAGAHDYLMKGNLSRLVPAVERELREAHIRADQRRARSALAESEKRYRLLWNASPDAVLLMDVEGTIHFASPAVETIFGYKPEELIGRNISLLEPPELAGQPGAGLKRFLRTDAIPPKGSAYETVGRHRDGSEIPIDASFGAMEFQGQRYVVAFVRDISARKRAELELDESRKALSLAAEIQQRLFPKEPPHVPGFDVAGASYAAEAAGGDYFDYLRMLGGKLGLVIGDVTGHGVGPALIMAETRAYLRLLATRRDNVGDILTVANRALVEDVGDERFVTLFLAQLNPKTRSLVYASAGHTPGLLLDAHGKVKAELRRTGIPLGLLPDTRYRASNEIALAPGDILLLLTDGLLEAHAPDGAMFGVDKAVETVRACRELPARQIVEKIYQAAREHAAGQPQLDDITLMVAKVLPVGSGHPSAQS